MTRIIIVSWLVVLLALSTSVTAAPSGREAARVVERGIWEDFAARFTWWTYRPQRPTRTRTVTLPASTPNPEPTTTEVQSSVTEPISESTPAPSPTETTTETTPVTTPGTSSTPELPVETPTTSTTPVSTPTPPPSQALTPDQETYLNLHNIARQQHGAANLTWSNELEAAAQEWANGCKFVHSGGAVGPFGENLAAGTGSFTIPAAIKLWTDEAAQYNPQQPVASHFTQVVWKATTQLGCAVASCSGIFDASFGKANYYVCEYSPVGNVIGQFGANVQP